jgi:hypothetical protein
MRGRRRDADRGCAAARQDRQTGSARPSESRPGHASDGNPRGATTMHVVTAGVLCCAQVSASVARKKSAVGVVGAICGGLRPGPQQVGCSWSYSACRIGRLVTIRQPSTGSGRASHCGSCELWRLRCAWRKRRAAAHLEPPDCVAHVELLAEAAPRQERRSKPPWPGRTQIGAKRPTLHAK